MGMSKQGEQRHAWLRALGPDDMPERIELSDGEYRHVRTYKHDFFAATGLYEGPSGLVILKLGRVVRFLGLPMVWLGRFLARREYEVYRAVDDLPGVPRCRGLWGETGFVHDFMVGHPLQRKEKVDAEFFPRLQELILQMHVRDIAYVDLEKRENILVDEQGRPGLIDFQISWRWPAGQKREGLRRLIPDAVGRYILERLQRADLYHLRKHHRRHRREDLTAEEIAASYRTGILISLHRRFIRPLTLLRRAILKQLTGRSRSKKQEGAEFLENQSGPPTA
jgi:hypothetical protein